MHNKIQYIIVLIAISFIVCIFFFARWQSKQKDELIRKEYEFYKANKDSIDAANPIKEVKIPKYKDPTKKVKVENSAWDSSVWQVEKYLEKNLNDPKSYEGIEWSEVTKTGSDGFMVRHKYRAKNSFGGYVIANQVFHLDSEGNVIEVVDYK